MPKLLQLPKFKLYNLISQKFTERFNNFKNISFTENDNEFISTEIIEYDQHFKYLRFPDFTNKHLKGFVLRIDINPCLKETGSMTKIYCISRYHNPINGTEILDFLDRSKAICEIIINELSTVYKKIFNNFLNDVLKQSEKDINNTPHVIFSRVVGSSDESTKEFIRLSSSNDLLQKFCKNNPNAQKIQNILRCLSELTGKPWNLADYEWITHKVTLKEKDKSREASGYIGYKSDDECTHFIGVVDSYPQDVLLPIHLEIIRSN